VHAADYLGESVDRVLDQVASNSSSPIAASGIPVDASAVAPARWLRISVTRGGRMVVQVCFPSYAVLSLSDLVPDDVRVRVVDQQVDLEKVAADAAARGCPSGDLFSIKAGDHAVRAWLD
jgi:hypothetical protein